MAKLKDVCSCNCDVILIFVFILFLKNKHLIFPFKSAHEYGDTDSIEYLNSCTNKTHQTTRYSCSAKHHDCSMFERFISKTNLKRIDIETRHALKEIINEILTNQINEEDLFTLE